MVEEAKLAGRVKAERKAKKDKERELREKCGRIFCSGCFERDFTIFNKLHTPDYYSNMKLVKTSQVQDPNPNSPTRGQTIGVHKDYVCQNTFVEKGAEIKCPGRTSVYYWLHELPKEETEKIKV